MSTHPPGQLEGLLPALSGSSLVHGHGRVPPVQLLHRHVRYLLNGNHFPDSGRHHAALHEAELDPEETFALMMEYLCY